MVDYLIKSSSWLPSWLSDLFQTEEALVDQENSLSPDEFRETLQSFSAELKHDSFWKRNPATDRQLPYFRNLEKDRAGTLQDVSGQIEALSTLGPKSGLSAAVQLYDQIRFNQNLPQEGKMVKAFKYELATAIVLGNELEKQIEAGLNLLKLAQILSYKKELAACSASPVQVDHIPFKFHYEKTSETSFVPHEALNDTIIAREYDKTAKEDSLRALSLDKLLETISQAEDYLNSGAVGSELLAAFPKKSETFLPDNSTTVSSILAYLEKGVENTRLNDFLLNVEILGFMETASDDKNDELTNLENEIKELSDLSASLAIVLQDEDIILDPQQTKQYVMQLLWHEKIKYQDLINDPGFIITDILSFKLSRLHEIFNELGKMPENESLDCIKRGIELLLEFRLAEWKSKAAEITNGDPAYEAYLNKISDYGSQNPSEAVAAIAAFHKYHKTRPMEKNIDDQLRALQAMLALAEKVSGHGRDHVSPIKYTIELLESAKFNLRAGNTLEAEAYFLEAVASPHFEYVKHVAELNENALWTKTAFETGIEIGATILAASFAQVAEAGAASSLAWVNIMRIRTAEEAITLFRSTVSSAKALRFGASTVGFAEASRILHGTPFVNDRLSATENVADHLFDAAGMAFTLGSIKLGMFGTMTALDRKFIVKTAAENVKRSGRFVTKEAIVAETEAIKQSFGRWEAFGYKSVLFAGEYASFTAADVLSSAGREIYHTGISDINWNRVYENTLSMQANVHRAAFLSGLKIFQATIARPVVKFGSEISKNIIFKANRKYFDTYNKKTTAALSHLQELTAPGKKDISGGEVKKWIKEAREALEARIALKEQLPSTVGEWALAEERAALAELKEMERSEVCEAKSGLLKVGDGFLTTPQVTGGGHVVRGPSFKQIWEHSDPAQKTALLRQLYNDAIREGGKVQRPLQEVSYALDWNGIEARVPGMDNPNPKEAAEFIAEIMRQLDPLFVKSEAYDALYYRDFKTHSDGYNAAKAELRNAITGIVARYGNVLDAIMQKAGAEPFNFAGELEFYRPHALAEAERLLILANEKGDPKNPKLYEALGAEEERIEKAFEDAKAKAGDVPVPQRFAGIDDPAARQTLYDRLTAPFIAAARDLILPARARQNDVLRRSGRENTTIYDYRAEGLYGENYGMAAEIADKLTKATEADNLEFLGMVAKARGVSIDELRPTDIEWAARVIVEKTAGLGETPVMTEAEAISGIQRLCRDMFNVDVSDIIFIMNGQSGQKASNGVSVSWADGEMIIVNIDPERITLPAFEKILHEVGHSIHHLIAKTVFSQKGSQNLLATSTAMPEISEAIAKIVADTIDDPQLIGQYLPEGRFSQEYLESYAKIRNLYEKHKLRRSIFIANAAKVMADPAFPTFEEKRQELARLQKVYLGIGGNADWIFGVTHLANRDWYAYFMKYVLADHVAGQVEAMAQANNKTVAQTFEPILSLGGLVTPRQMHALGLGISGQSVQRVLDSILAVPSGAGTFEAISHPYKASEAGKVFASNPSAFFGHLREYFHNSATVMGNSHRVHAEDIAKKAACNEASEDEIRQLTEYAASMIRLLTFIETVETTPWLKDALITNSKFTNKYNQQLADINNLQASISRYRSLLTDVVLRMLSNAANTSYGATQQGDFLDAATYLFAALETRIAKEGENAVILHYQGSLNDADFASRLIGIKGELRKAIGITTILSDVIKLFPIADEDSRIINLRRKLHNFRTSMSTVAEIEDEMFRLPDFLKRVILPILIAPRTDTLLATKVGNIAEVMAKKAGRAVQIDIDPSLQQSSREIDLERGKMLEEAIINIFSNAVKYGQNISLKISLDNNSNIIVIVNNDGISLSPFELVDYGKKGWRSHEAKSSNIKGEGLGAGSVLEIVEKLGGTLEITSTNVNFLTSASLIYGRMVIEECKIVTNGSNKVTVFLKVPLKNLVASVLKPPPEPEQIMTTPPPDQTPAAAAGAAAQSAEIVPASRRYTNVDDGTVDFMGTQAVVTTAFVLGRSLVESLRAYLRRNEPESSGNTTDISPIAQLAGLAQEVAEIKAQSIVSTGKLDILEETSVQSFADGAAGFFINHPEGRSNFAAFCEKSGMNQKDAVELLQFSIFKASDSETGWAYTAPSGETVFVSNPHEAFGYKLAEAASAGSANLWQYIGGLKNNRKVLRINALNLGQVPKEILLAARRQNISLASTIQEMDPEKSDVLIFGEMIAGHVFVAARASKVGTILVGFPKEGEDVVTGLQKSGWAVSKLNIGGRESILAVKMKDVAIVDDDEVQITDERDNPAVPPAETIVARPARSGTGIMPAAGKKPEEPPPVVVRQPLTDSGFDLATDVGKATIMLRAFVRAWPKDLFAALGVSESGKLWSRATADVASTKSALTDLAEIVYQRAIMPVPIGRGKTEPRATMIVNFARSSRANPDIRIPRDSDLTQQIKIFDGIFRTIVTANGSDEWRHYAITLMKRFAEAESPFIRIDAKTMQDIIYVVDIQREQFYFLDGNMIAEPNEKQTKLIVKFYEELAKAVQTEDYIQLALARGELEYNNPFLYRVAEGRAIRKAQTPEMKDKMKAAIQGAIALMKGHGG